MSDRPSVLFVCLGNICRSPLAEAALRAAAAERGIAVDVDSAGTGPWHVGDPPDRRAQATAARYGIDISASRGRQVDPRDFNRFMHIVAMDRDNLDTLLRMQPAGATAKVSLLLDHVPGRVGEAIADPYYGGLEGFETAWADVSAGARGLLAILSGNQ